MKVYLFVILLSVLVLMIVLVSRKNTLASGTFRWKLHASSLIKTEKCQCCETANASISNLRLRTSLSSAAGTAAAAAPQVPQSIDLFAGDTTTYFDQGMWGSCTAFAMKYALAIYGRSTSTYALVASAAHLYAQSRKLLGLGVTQDTGSSNWATAQVVQKQGIINDTQFPYWASNIFTDPSRSLGSSLAPSIRANFTNFVFSTNPTTNLANIKAVLATRPLIIAIVMYKSSMTTKVLVSGLIPMPNSSDLRGGVVGGHAICLTGYDATHFIFRNSWGTDVGINGTFKLPYAYLTTTSKGRMSYVSDAYYYV